MKLAAYVRVSTDGQADEGFGLDIQRKSIKRWATANGHRIVRWCSDEGVSGALDALDREGLACVVDAVESGHAEGAVVARLDRLARKLTVQEAALAHLWRAGGSVFAVDGGEVLQDDSDDPMRTAMRQMVGVFSELERSMIAKRMRDGRRAKAERGGYAFGRPGYGFKAEGGELVTDDAQQAALRRIRELRAEGRSYREMADILTAEGHKPKGNKTETSGKWHPESLRRIVARGAPTPRRSRESPA